MRALIWSPRAKSDYLNLLDYLHSNWGKQVTLRYVQRITALLDLICRKPELFPTAGKANLVRRCVVTKQTTLYYRLNKVNQIEVITIFDTRQNPLKRRL